MVIKIPSSPLWDRLSFILGAGAEFLGPRPEKHSSSFVDTYVNRYENEKFVVSASADEEACEAAEEIIDELKEYACLIALGDGPDPHNDPFTLKTYCHVQFVYIPFGSEKREWIENIYYGAPSVARAVSYPIKYWMYFQRQVPDQFYDLVSVQVREMNSISFDDGEPDLEDGPWIFSWHKDQSANSYESAVLDAICNSSEGTGEDNSDA